MCGQRHAYIAVQYAPLSVDFWLIIVIDTKIKQYFILLRLLCTLTPSSFRLIRLEANATNLQQPLCCRVSDAALLDEGPEGCIIQVVDVTCYYVIMTFQILR